MHRTLSRRHPLLWGGVLLALLTLSGPATRARAQGPVAPRGSALVVPVNGTVRLQMSTKQPIRTVTNPKEAVVNIRTIPGDPTAVLLIGMQPEVTHIDLEDVNGRRETFEVIVQTDVEYLRTQIKNGLPTANITLIPTANNSVVLTGTVTRAEDVNIAQSIAQSVGFRVINALRVGGVQQVQLDVVVAQVSRAEFRRMAFDFFQTSKNFFLGSTVGQAVAQPTSVGGFGAGAAGILGPGGGLTATPGAPNGTPTNLLFGIIHSHWAFLGFLQALKDQNVLKLMAEPRLVTLSGRPASFLSGGEQAVPVPAGLGQIGVQFEEFGTRLNFIPIVLGNGKIYIEVEPEVSNLDPASGVSIGGTTVPGRVTQRVNTSIEMESGQTFVIGGLIQHQVLASAQKVPILGELPFLGALFSSKAYQETEQEVVIMVTPYLVDAESCDQRPRVLPGQETRTPDDFELFLENILEAPRGPREVFHGGTYVPAYKNGPSYNQFPCAGISTATSGGAGAGGCGAGGCGVGGPMGGPGGPGGPGGNVLAPLPGYNSVPPNPAAGPAPGTPAVPVKNEEAAGDEPGGGPPAPGGGDQK